MYNPNATLRDSINLSAYERAQALEEVLKKCGDDLTRANVMKQAATLDFEIGMLRPGIRVTTSPTNYQPIKQLSLVRFNGKIGFRYKRTLRLIDPARLAAAAWRCPATLWQLCRRFASVVYSFS